MNKFHDIKKGRRILDRVFYKASIICAQHDVLWLLATFTCALTPLPPCPALISTLSPPCFHSFALTLLPPCLHPHTHSSPWAVEVPVKQRGLQQNAKKCMVYGVYKSYRRRRLGRTGRVQRPFEHSLWVMGLLTVCVILSGLLDRQKRLDLRYCPVGRALVPCTGL